jgi:hypothetical protein
LKALNFCPTTTTTNKQNPVLRRRKQVEGFPLSQPIYLVEELELVSVLRGSCRKRTRKMLPVGERELQRGRKAPQEGRRLRMREKRLYRLWYGLPL